MRTVPRRSRAVGSSNAGIVLFGGTDTALAVASAAHSAGVRIAGVVTLGQAFQISYSAHSVTSSRYANVREWCENHGVSAIPFSTYEESLARIGGSNFALGVVAGWYHMVPSKVRSRFALGCVGFHASLLPKLRGGAPLNWAILSGARETGVTMFELGDGVDDGLIYGQQRFRVGTLARVADLIAKANEASAALARCYLPMILSGRVKPRPQRGEPTFALQRQPEDGRIDWRLPAVRIERLVRASGRPYPGAFSELEGQPVYIWEASLPRRAFEVHGAPGQIALVPGIRAPVVVTGAGVLVIDEATDGKGVSVMGRLAKSGQKRFGS